MGRRIAGSAPHQQGSKMPQLILIRHGQSQWNLQNRFTGWRDVDVTEKGAAAEWAAGELMKVKGIAADSSFNSVQTRANQSLDQTEERMVRHKCVRNDK